MRVPNRGLRVIGTCALLMSAMHSEFTVLCRKGGPLAVTDANLVLGRLVPQYFPQIFGKNANEPLDIQASLTQFEELAKEINATYEKKLGLDEVVYG